jgi:hypothetical protein
MSHAAPGPGQVGGDLLDVLPGGHAFQISQPSFLERPLDG